MKTPQKTIEEARARVARLVAVRSDRAADLAARRELAGVTAFAEAKPIAREHGDPHADVVKAITPTDQQLGDAGAGRWAKDAEREKAEREAKEREKTDKTRN